MVSVQSGGIKDAKTLQSRLVATLAALSTLGDASSRPTKVFRVATGPLHRFSPIALLLCGSAAVVTQPSCQQATQKLRPPKLAS
jgi:hypothetical protein